MTVYITDDELDTFNNHGFSDRQVDKAVEYYRREGFEDDAIRGRIDKRLNDWAKQETTNITPQQETQENKNPVIKGNVEKTVWQKFNDFIEKSNEDSKNLENQIDERIKSNARENLRKRAEWEEKHPVISGFQKDFQPTLMGKPSYRGQVPQWELEAKYGIKAPLKEYLKTEGKTAGLNSVSLINIFTDFVAGGEGTAVKQAGKQGLKQLFKQGAKRGLKTGLIGGGVQGLTSSAGDIIQDNANPMELLTRPLEYGLLGSIGGTVLGGTLEAANPFIQKGINYLGENATPFIKGIANKVRRKTPLTTVKAPQETIENIFLKNDIRSNSILQKDKENYINTIEKIKGGVAKVHSKFDVLSETPQIWQQYGLPNRKILMKKETFKKAGNLPNRKHRNHDVGDNVLNNLPELLQDPNYILKSATDENSFIGVLNATDKQGYPVVVAIKPLEDKLQVNIIQSIYGREKFDNWITKQANNILYKKEYLYPLINPYPIGNLLKIHLDKGGKIP